MTAVLLEAVSVGDVGATYAVTIFDANGVVPLDGKTVTWLLTRGSTYIVGSADIVDGPAGQASYTTVEGDFPFASEDWEQQWRVIGSGMDLFFPPDPNIQPVRNNIAEPGT
jgi:hypothetical protein